MAARVRPRESQCVRDVPVPDTVWKLPADLLLEIVARSDIVTLVTITAACKFVRRDVLEPSFIRRVTGQGGILPPGILAYLNTHDEQDNMSLSLSLVHPTLPAAASFVDVRLSPYLSGLANDLLGDHCPIKSRGGLVLFQRWNVRTQLPKNLCVYDLITGHRTSIPDPPGIESDRCFDFCVLLTAADGIGCSFMLFVANIVEVHGDNNARTIQVHAATSMCGMWAPSVMMHNNSGFLLDHWQGVYGNIVVLEGGIIHWLVHSYEEIFSYNVRTMKQSTIKLPAHFANFEGSLDLGSYYSHDGRKLLRLLGIDGFKISMWHQLSGGSWESEAVMIDMEEKLRSLENNNGPREPSFVELRYFGEGSNTVFLHAYMGLPITTTFLPIVLDLETKELCVCSSTQPHHPLYWRSICHLGYER